MDSKTILKRDDIMEFITRLCGGDLHAKLISQMGASSTRQNESGLSSLE